MTGLSSTMAAAAAPRGAPLGGVLIGTVTGGGESRNEEPRAGGTFIAGRLGNRKGRNPKAGAPPPTSAAGHMSCPHLSAEMGGGGAVDLLLVSPLLSSHKGGVVGLALLKLCRGNAPMG